jgi:cytoskeleton protein RodZ
MARGNFGERLKRERELREVTQQEITSATRIGPRFLEALENEDWDKLPGGVFNRGFVRSVARYLGLDEEALLAEYDLAHGTHVPPPSERPEDRIPAPPRWLPFALVLGLILVLAAIVAAGVYGCRYYRSHHPRGAALPASAATPPQAAQPAGTSSDPSVPLAATSKAGSAVDSLLELSVSASAATHLRVLCDGHLFFDNDVRAGENHHFIAADGFEVSAADSGAVLLELNGQAVAPLGVPGSSGTIKLNRKDLRQANGGKSHP